MKSKSKKKSDNGFEIASLDELPDVPKTEDQLNQDKLNSLKSDSETQTPFDFLESDKEKSPQPESEQASSPDSEQPQDMNAKLESLKKEISVEEESSIPDSAGVGVLYTTRAGSPGIDTLDTFTIPSLDFHKYFGAENHLYVNANFLNMSNGKIDKDGLQRFGDKKSGGNIENVTSLSEGIIGYEYKTESSLINLEVGTASQPAIAKQKTLWTAKVGKTIGNLSLEIASVNKTVKDSLVSSIGDSYKYVYVDPTIKDNALTKDVNESIQTGTGIRGGVTKTGIETGVKYSAGDQIFAMNLNYYYDVSGLNVFPNKETAMAILYLKVLDLPKVYNAMVGPIILYDNFNYNSNYFTVGSEGIGNGGYFSPKNFILFGVYYDIAKKETESLFWKVKGNVGFVNFTGGADLYDSTSSESKISSFGYEIKGFLGYKADNSIQFLAGAGYQSSGVFNSLFFGLSAIYYFGDKKQISADDLAYSNTIGAMAK